jgi:hypothetical protein
MSTIDSGWRQIGIGGTQTSGSTIRELRVFCCLYGNIGFLSCASFLSSPRGKQLPLSRCNRLLDATLRRNRC